MNAPFLIVAKHQLGSKSKQVSTKLHDGWVPVLAIDWVMHETAEKTNIRGSKYRFGEMRDTRKFRAGYGMKLSWWDRDALLFAGGMRDYLK